MPALCLTVMESLIGCFNAVRLNRGIEPLHRGFSSRRLSETVSHCARSLVHWSDSSAFVAAFIGMDEGIAAQRGIDEADSWLNPVLSGEIKKPQ